MGFMNISDGLNSRRRERARQLVWSRIRRAKRCCGLAFHQGATGGRTDAAKSGPGMRESICLTWGLFRPRVATCATK